MHRETAQAIWYRRLDRNCFTSKDASADTAAAEQRPTAAPVQKGRWFPRLWGVNAAEEWRPLAEERRRWAVEASGDNAY
jgi:hypothetical protein